MEAGLLFLLGELRSLRWCAGPQSLARLVHLFLRLKNSRCRFDGIGDRTVDSCLQGFLFVVGAVTGRGVVRRRGGVLFEGTEQELGDL